MLRRQLLVTVALMAGGLAVGKPVLVDDFESQAPGWTKNVKGKGTVEIVPGGVKGNCLRIESREKALAYYTTMLPLAEVKGKRLVIRAKVKLENVVRGDRIYAEAKLHALIRYRDKKRAPRNIATRFRGTADWHDQLMIVEVPDDAASVQLDLGIQNGDGVVWYDDLKVDDGVKNQICVNLRNITNTCREDISPKSGYGGFIDAGELDLRDFPAGDWKFDDTDFYLMTDTEQFGRSCVVLGEPNGQDCPCGRSRSRRSKPEPRPCIFCTLLLGRTRRASVPACKWRSPIPTARRIPSQCMKARTSATSWHPQTAPTGTWSGPRSVAQPRLVWV